MAENIKCDQMADGWNYDTCWECKHFLTSRTSKGRIWRCKLNNRTAAEKRAFYTLWGINYLIERDMLDESCRSEVAVEYVGKRRRGRV